MRLTANQQHVFNALRQPPQALTAYALLAQLRVVGLNAPTQVGRALRAHHRPQPQP